MVFNFEEFIIPSYYLSGQSNNNRWKWRYYLFKKIWQGDGVGTNSYLKIKKNIMRDHVAVQMDSISFSKQNEGVMQLKLNDNSWNKCLNISKGYGSEHEHVIYSKLLASKFFLM